MFHFNFNFNFIKRIFINTGTKCIAFFTLTTYCSIIIANAQNTPVVTAKTNVSSKTDHQQQHQHIAPNFIICGNIANAADTVVSLQMATNPLSPTQKTQVKDNMDAKGNFCIKTTIPLPMQILFVNQGRALPIYAAPGDSLYLTMHPASGKNTNIQFTGSSANEQIYLLQQSSLLATIKKYEDPEKLTLAYGDYKKYADSLLTIQLNYAISFFATNKVSPGFERIAKRDLHYTHGAAIAGYPYLHARSTKNKGLKTNMNVNYYAFQNNAEAPLHNDEMIYYPSYTNYLQTYMLSEVGKKIDNNPKYDASDFYADMAKSTISLLKGAPLQYALARVFIEGITNGKPDNILPYYDDLQKTNPPAELLKITDVYYQRAAKMARGTAASDFTAQDSTGKTVTLADFKGKVVYLDFWATWCGPCRKEMPHSKELVKKYKDNKDIVFLYTSVDKDKNAWLKFLNDNEKGFGGTHIWAGTNKSINEAYQISGIPRFVIIDRNGKLYDGNARRPSDPLLTKDLEAALKIK